MTENKTEIIGEVVLVDSLTKFQIQQIAGGEDVELGKFIITERNKIFGILGDIIIQNPDFGTYPRPKRLPNDLDIGSIYPDLIEQFPTIITVYVLGHFENENVYQTIPLRPPQIYDKVRLATNEEIRSFHKVSENQFPRLEYLLRIQEFEQSPIMDTLLRTLITKLAETFQIDPEEVMEVLS